MADSTSSNDNPPDGQPSPDAVRSSGDDIDAGGHARDVGSTSAIEAAGRARREAFLAGVVGAGAALAFGELAAGLSRRVPSLVVAVADLVIRGTDGDTARTAIDLLGSNNKPFLLTGIVVVSLLLGGLSARGALRRPWLVPTVFTIFGAFGAWAAQRTPFTSAGLSVAVALIAASIGAVATRWLLARVPSSVAPASPVASSLAEHGPRGDADGGADAGRRRFVGAAVGVGAAAAATGALGRTLRANNTVESERAEVAAQLAEARVAPERAARAVDTTGPAADVEGVTPYITPNQDFYRIDTSAEVPQIDPADWSMRIRGRVDRELELTLDDLLAEELVEETVTISCVSNPIGGGYAGTAVWTGVPLERLFERAGVHDDATQVIGRSFTGWTGGFPTDVVGDGRTSMVAVAMNGEPLPTRHGFPARLIVAGLYGYVSATKWLSEVELTRWEDFDAFWIQRGWAKEGPVKITSRIDVPRGGRLDGTGPVVLAGVAWAPTTGIGSVEVRLDAIDEWLPAELGDAVSGETWVQWTAAVDLPPGSHVAQVRAIDRNGVVQSDGPAPVFPDGAEGYHRVRFDVA